jgi:hypothetical protein
VSAGDRGLGLRLALEEDGYDAPERSALVRDVRALRPTCANRPDSDPASSWTPCFIIGAALPDRRSANFALGRFGMPSLALWKWLSRKAILRWAPVEGKIGAAKSSDASGVN